MPESTEGHSARMQNASRRHSLPLRPQPWTRTRQAHCLQPVAAAQPLRSATLDTNTPSPLSTACSVARFCNTLGCNNQHTRHRLDGKEEGTGKEGARAGTIPGLPDRRHGLGLRGVRSVDYHLAVRRALCAHTVPTLTKVGQ